MNMNPIRRRRTMSIPDDRVSDIRRDSDVEGFDGFVESLQWTAGAVHGSDIRSTVAYPAGMGAGCAGMDVGRRPSGRPACGGNAATMGGRSRMWPSWSKWKSYLDWATCKARPGMEVTRC